MSLIGVVSFRALYMGGYDNAKLAFDLEHSSIGTRFVIAQVLTAVVGTVTYPIDTVRRKLMMMVDGDMFTHSVG